MSQDELYTVRYRLIVFYLAAWVDKSETEPIQSEPFRAPEVILGTKWNRSVDIWNLGCLVSSGPLLPLALLEH